MRLVRIRTWPLIVGPVVAAILSLLHNIFNRISGDIATSQMNTPSGIFMVGSDSVNFTYYALMVITCVVTIALAVRIHKKGSV